MVVKKIEDLQQKNTELESRLKDLPSPTEGGTHTYSTEMVSNGVWLQIVKSRAVRQLH